MGRGWKLCAGFARARNLGQLRDISCIYVIFALRIAKIYTYIAIGLTPEIEEIATIALGNSSGYLVVHCRFLS